MTQWRVRRVLGVWFEMDDDGVDCFPQGISPRSFAMV
jgi:hypothetical protein